MGLEIGFNVWKNEDGKLVKYDLSEGEQDRTWVCGRCDVTNAWEYGQSTDFAKDRFIEPVFNEEFDKYLVDTEDSDYKVILNYVDFHKFKEHIMQAIDEAYHTIAESVTRAKTYIVELNEQIKEYQELQLRSTTDFVFDKFQEKVEDCRKLITEEQQYIDDSAKENHYQIKAVENMLNDIEKYLKQGLVVTTYFSY